MLMLPYILYAEVYIKRIIACKKRPLQIPGRYSFGFIRFVDYDRAKLNILNGSVYVNPRTRSLTVVRVLLELFSLLIATA